MVLPVYISGKSKLINQNYVESVTPVAYGLKDWTLKALLKSMGIKEPKLKERLISILNRLYVTTLNRGKSPDYKLSSSSKNVDQYKSIGGQSTSVIQTLTLTARSQSATLALVIVGANKPVPVFLNTKKGDLPPIWQTLDNAVFEAGNTYQESKNFFGQTIYIVNLSLTEDATFDTRLQ